MEDSWSHGADVVVAGKCPTLGNEPSPFRYLLSWINRYRTVFPKDYYLTPPDYSKIRSCPAECPCKVDRSSVIDQLVHKTNAHFGGGGHADQPSQVIQSIPDKRRFLIGQRRQRL